MNQRIIEFLKGAKGSQKADAKYYKRELRNNRWKYWYTKEEYDKDHPVVQEPKKESIWKKIGLFFGLKSDQEIVSKVKSDYSQSKSEIESQVGEPVSFETFKDHLAEYFQNKEQWDKKLLAATPKPKPEEPKSQVESEPTEILLAPEDEIVSEEPKTLKEKIQVKADEFEKPKPKWNLKLMRFIAGKYSQPIQLSAPNINSLKPFSEFNSEEYNEKLQALMQAYNTEPGNKSVIIFDLRVGGGINGVLEDLKLGKFTEQEVRDVARDLKQLIDGYEISQIQGFRNSIITGSYIDEMLEKLNGSKPNNFDTMPEPEKKAKAIENLSKLIKSRSKSSNLESQSIYDKQLQLLSGSKTKEEFDRNYNKIMEGTEHFSMPVSMQNDFDAEVKSLEEKFNSGSLSDKDISDQISKAEKELQDAKDLNDDSELGWARVEKAREKYRSALKEKYKNDGFKSLSDLEKVTIQRIYGTEPPDKFPVNSDGDLDMKWMVEYAKKQKAIESLEKAKKKSPKVSKGNSLSKKRATKTFVDPLGSSPSGADASFEVGILEGNLDDNSTNQDSKSQVELKQKALNSLEKKKKKKTDSPATESGENSESTSDKLKTVPASDITTIEQYTDVKHYNRKVIDGIKESILAKGFDPGSPIKVDRDENGKLRVVDGHHRFTAVNELIKEGKLPSNTPVYVIEEKFDSEADRLLAQVSANKNKRKPERLDDAKAYAKLIEQGKSIQDISKVTGENPDHIRGTLALNNLSDDFKSLLRSDSKQDRTKSKGDGSEEKNQSLGEALGVVLGKYGVNEDGTPNETLQRKAFSWYNANRSKGVTVPQVRNYIETMKNQQGLGMKGVDDSGRSDVEKEALRMVGSEDDAKGNTAAFENLLNQIQKPIQKFLGDTVTDLDDRGTAKLAASIIASKGESALQTELDKISVALNNLNLFKESLAKKFAQIQADAMTPMMFGA